MNQEKPTVSVIIPTFNRADLIPDALCSVLNQTFQDFEIIIIDDGSEDNTKEVADEYTACDARIKYFKHEKNKGGAAARNTGIINARGKFIAFLDSDCQWLPQKLEKQLKLFREGDSKLGAVGCGAINVGANSTRISLRKGRFGDIYKLLLTEACVGKKKGWPGGTPTIIIKKECVDKIGLFDEKLASCQEYDMYIRLARSYHFDVVPETMVKIFSDRSDGISKNINAKLLGRKRMLDKYRKEMPRLSKVKSHYNYLVGTTLYRMGNIKEGNKYLLKAVASYPYDLKNWALFLMTVFPFRMYYSAFLKYKNKKL